MKAEMKLILFVFLLLSIVRTVSAQEYDMSVYISERMVNKMLLSMGRISNTESYKVSMIQGTYTWVLENPKIRLERNKASFVADISVDSGPLKYKDKVTGAIEVKYNSNTDKIELRLAKALVEIKTKVLGKEILIKTIDIAEYFKTPFLFDGPLSFQEDFIFRMPDGSKKKITTQLLNFNLEVIPKYIRMQANIAFNDKSGKGVYLNEKSATMEPGKNIAPKTEKRKSILRKR